MPEHIYIVTDYDFGNQVLGLVFNNFNLAHAHAKSRLDEDLHEHDTRNIYRIIRTIVNDASALQTVRIVRGGLQEEN